MDRNDIDLAEVEMPDDELVGVYGGFVTQQQREVCEYEMPAGADHVFM